MARKKRTTSVPTTRPVSSKATGNASSVKVRPLTSDDWPIVERLFGPKGACGGCWCMLWRVPRGGQLWQERKGEQNRRDFKRLMTSGKVFGVLAFAVDEAVGWCCVGPKGDFPRLLNSRVLKTDSAPQTWSITCFYIPSHWRNCGVATAMLNEATTVAKANGAAAVEGYPARPYSEKQMPGAFAWTGVPRLFEKTEFINVSLPGASRDIYRKTLRGGRPRKSTVKI
ncbi:MAG: GNAT family N-acetyltransferase [Planctomycetes bacterium]|nr:GNAT family N-acetyltransferase [Planctomycetota bacterium]MBI3834390.1 GNAT family N-acetyltransferase [Planctomycetota bacterium]